MKSNASLLISLLCIFLLISSQTIGAVSENGEDRRSMQQISVPPNCAGRCGSGCKRCERVAVEVEPGEYVWRCECMGESTLQRSVPPSCYGRCGGCTPCVRVSEEVAPGEYVWKCVCKA